MQEDEQQILGVDQKKSNAGCDGFDGVNGFDGSDGCCDSDGFDGCGGLCESEEPMGPDVLVLKMEQRALCGRD